MKQKLLLIEDVHELGRSGEVVTVKAGYARNFLLPKKKGVIADKNTLRMQTRLQEERMKRAAVDKQASEELALKLEGLTVETTVKVDPEGHMYGSVSAFDIARLLQERGFSVERRHVVLHQSIKKVGTHDIALKLNEGVPATIALVIHPQVG